MDYFLNSPSITPSMINTTSAIVDMFIFLRENQLSHGNLHASNILIKHNQPTLIDLDCMNYHKNKNKAEHMWREDIAYFMNNWWERYDIDKQFMLAFAKHGIKI